MYKLTVISGPNIGSSYPIQRGEITLGRQTGNTIVLASSKISKSHCSISCSGSEVIVKDLGSSNGTFVNGILTKLKKLTLGDRISVGEYVLELVTVVKKSNQSLPAALPGFGEGLKLSNSRQIPDLMNVNSVLPTAHEAPKDLKGKLIWFLEQHVMPTFYGIYEKNEWNILGIGLFALLTLGSVVISVYPILETSRLSIVKESQVRARYIARQIAEQNAPFLASHSETKTDVGIAETAVGVQMAVLIDLDNRILAPSSKLNQYLNSGIEAPIVTKARDAFRAGRETGFSVEADSTTVIAVEPVKVMSPTAGKNVVVAMAVVSIDTTLSTPGFGEIGVAYSQAIILTGLFGFLIFFVLYRLTLKPFETLNEDMDKALKGEISQVSHKYQMSETNPLWDIINSAIQRVPKSGGAFGGDAGLMDMGGSVEDYLGPLKMLGNNLTVGIAVFDSQRKIAYLNPIFEEMSGIRFDSSVGRSMSEVARDEAMGAFTDDILNRAPIGGEGVTEEFDFSGITYKISVGAFGATGGAAKCFLFMAVRV